MLHAANGNINSL